MLRWGLISALTTFAVTVMSADTTMAATVRHVPSDYLTIQDAIDASADGDTVLVAPGVYHEKIDFDGKAISVIAASGPSVTTIDADRLGSVVSFTSGEGSNSVVNGFTLTDGFGWVDSFYSGGGVLIMNSSPTVTNNVIEDNSACADGGGIGIESGSPLISNNIVRNNRQSGCSGGGGAGIGVVGNSSPLIFGNEISGNHWAAGHGGGIHLNAAGTPRIVSNTIRGNSTTGVTPAADGGGIWIGFNEGVQVSQNIIDGNQADRGGGVAWYMAASGFVLANNTIINNDALQGGFGRSGRTGRTQRGCC